MIAGYPWALWVCGLLALFFFGNGIVNVIGPRGIRDGFARWGFPKGFHVANGLLDMAVAILIAFPRTRMIGLALAVLVCLAIFATLIRHREFSHLPPSVILLVIVLAAAWGVWA